MGIILRKPILVIRHPCKLNVFVEKLVLHRLKNFDIKNLRPLPASLYCKVVELYITIKWKHMDLKYFDFGMIVLEIWDLLQQSMLKWHKSHGNKL